MKKFLLSVAAAALSFGAYATTVEFDLTNMTAFGFEQGEPSTHTPVESLKSGDVTITVKDVTDTDGRWNFWTNASGVVDFRCTGTNAGSTLTFTAPENIVKIEFEGKAVAFKEVTNKVWTGDAKEAVLEATGKNQLSKCVVTYGEAAPVTPKTLYTSLGEADATCDWTLGAENLPEGLSYVWSWKEYNGAHYLNGSAYLNGTKYAVTEYAVSPVIDLSKVKGAKVAFDHAAKFQTTLLTHCGLCVRKEGDKDWTELTIPTWPEKGAWTFVNSGEIDLAAYDGSKIELAFKYGSTEDGADTWEVKNLVITGVGETSQPEPEPEPTPETVTVKSVKETIAQANATAVKIDYALTVGWVYNRNVFVCDEAGDFIQIYGENSLKVGDVIPAGWEGTYKLFNNVTPEIELGTTGLPAATAGTFEPKTVAAADVTTAMVNSVIKINDVVIAEATPAADADKDSRNFTGTVGNVTLSLRNNYALESVDAGTYNVTVVVTIFNEAPSLYVTNFEKTGSTGIEAVEAAAGEAEYFNLQGVRVANPENGLYIRRQGGKAVKVLVK